MDIATILSATQVYPEWAATCKKQMLQDIAHQAALHTGVPERDIFYGLLERERLGTTATGHGVAIPHTRVEGLKQVTALFFRLPHAVDFSASDDKPVDLVMVLLAPAGGQQTDHLRVLSTVTRLMRDRLICEKVRAAVSADTIYHLLTEEDEEEVL